jgi:hypothetical protein
MSSPLRQGLNSERLPSLARFLFDELFATEADLAKRICRLRFTLSWPELGVRVGSASRSRASSASA